MDKAWNFSPCYSSNGAELIIRGVRIMKITIYFGLIFMFFLAMTAFVQAGIQPDSADGYSLKTTDPGNETGFLVRTTDPEYETASLIKIIDIESKTEQPTSPGISDTSFCVVSDLVGMGSGASFSLVRDDGGLIIPVHDETTIVFQDGSSVRDALEDGQSLADFLKGKQLSVSYGPTTRSLVPQAFGPAVRIVVEG